MPRRRVPWFWIGFTIFLGGQIASCVYLVTRPAPSTLVHTEDRCCGR